MLGTFLSRTPEAAERLSTLGQEYEGYGYLSVAEWLFRRALLQGGADSTRHFHLGRTLARRGRLEEAKAHLVRALELKSDFYLCRVAFFELCREQYWQGAAPRRTGSPLPPPPIAPPDASLGAFHACLAELLSPWLRDELARFDEESIDIPVLERLATLAATGMSLDRATRKHLNALLELRPAFEQARSVLEGLRLAPPPRLDRRVRLHFRKQPTLELYALRDSDDLTGTHLEVVSGGSLSFVPFDAIARIELGPNSEFTEATLALEDGTEQQVVVPTLYFGTRRSTHRELQVGEFTLLKTLIPGIKIGIGRRVLEGLEQETRRMVATPLQSLEVLEFL